MRNYAWAVIAAVLSPLFLVAQQTKITTNAPIDTRLYAAFGNAYIDKVAAEDPFTVKRWTYYLDNAFFISDTPLSKDGSEPTDLPTVRIVDLQRINILQLEKEQPQLKRDFYEEAIYKIEGTNKYLVYYAGQDFIEKLKAHFSKL
jgi:hypothetical protein